MKPSLLILAAGMGSRYGGIKQIDSFGPHGEKIIDYSIYDAIRAGFGKVVFVIRKEIENDFRDAVLGKFDDLIDIEFAFQELTLNYPDLPAVPDRQKPWGTSHAVLCARHKINEPFAVINADDFYGADAFVQMANFLTSDSDDKRHSMVGYRLSNTLSEFGSVSRCVCNTDDKGFLLSVTEMTKIYRKDGQIVAEDSDSLKALPENTIVSMNFWGFKPNIFTYLESQFIEFVKENHTNLKAEFYIPLSVDLLMKNNGFRVKVLDNAAEWFGVTYREDREFVDKSLNRLIRAGAYPENLWNV
jgi:UTP-glucose-1-phosphate uridylyltransferase